LEPAINRIQPAFGHFGHTRKKEKKRLHRAKNKKGTTLIESRKAGIALLECLGVTVAVRKFS